MVGRGTHHARSPAARNGPSHADGSLLGFHARGSPGSRYPRATSTVLYPDFGTMTRISGSSTATGSTWVNLQTSVAGSLASTSGQIFRTVSRSRGRWAVDGALLDDSATEDNRVGPGVRPVLGAVASLAARADETSISDPSVTTESPAAAFPPARGAVEVIRPTVPSCSLVTGFFFTATASGLGPMGAPDSSAVETLDERFERHNVFQPRDTHEGHLDQESPMQAAAQSSSVFGQDLEGGQHRVDRPSPDDLIEPGSLPRGDGQEDRVGTQRQHQAVAEEVEHAAEQFGRLDALIGRLLQQPECSRGIVVGQGF